jgi:hypothetical protein
MQLEASAVIFAVGTLVIAVGALAARDHTTPLIDLIRQNAGFVIVAFFVPFVLLQVISPTLPQPWRGAAVGGIAFAWAGLSAAYLQRDPARARLNARNALIGAVVFAVAGVAFGNGWPN